MELESSSSMHLAFIPNSVCEGNGEVFANHSFRMLGSILKATQPGRRSFAADHREFSDDSGGGGTRYRRHTRSDGGTRAAGALIFRFLRIFLVNEYGNGSAAGGSGAGGDRVRI